MEYSGREEPQGAVGPSLDQVGQQFSYIGEDELPDVKNSKSPDSGRRNGTRPGKTRSGRNRQPRDTDYFIRCKQLFLFTDIIYSGFIPL